MIGQENPYEAPKVRTEAKVGGMYGFFRDNRKLGFAVILFGVLALLVEGVWAWLTLEEIRAYREVGSFDGVYTELEEMLYAVCSAGYWAVWFPWLILLLIWVNRSAKNGWMVDTERKFMSYKPGWAAGCFVVPILNLWHPVIAMSELVDSSFGKKSKRSLLTLWWSMRILMVLLGVGSGIAPTSTDAELLLLDQAHLILSGVTVLYILSEIWLIRMVTRRQYERGRELELID